MAIDITVLGLVLFFGLLGALSGASRQLAHLLALVVAGLSARPGGAWVAPLLVERGGVARPLGVVVGTVLVFLATYLAVRLVTTPLLRRALAGEAEERAGTDRWLGFALGALKVSAVLYVLLSAATFVEDHVAVGGHRFDLGLKDSVSGGLARRHNLFRWTGDGPAQHLAALIRRAHAPDGSRRLAKDPELRAIQQDPRFRRLLRDPEVRRAARSGDWDALLHAEPVQRLAADPDFARRLQAAVGQ